jgi:hypothetical protein
MNGKILVGAALVISIATIPALAHHSYSMFELEKELTVKGTVKEFLWTNPHAWIKVMVPNKEGQADLWEVQMGSPGSLVQRGWNSKTLRPGDNISLTMHPVKDGSHGGEYTSVTLPGGKVIEDRLGGQHTGPNAD